MLSLKKQERRCTRFLLRKAEGGVQIYILCMVVLLVFVVYFAALIDYKRMAITSEAVDDALVTSLVSSCLYNKDEERLSGAIVVYRTVTGDGLKLPITDIIPGYDDVSGNLTDSVDDRDVISGEEVMNPSGDTFLSNSYSLFRKNLKKNLKLDDAMECSMSGIDGEVTIAEFSIYNKFYNLDENGEQSDFRFIKYTHVGGGVFSCTPYNINEYPTCYNSLDHSMYTIAESSVVSTLSFRVLATRYDAGGDADGAHTYQDVTYTRVVDIKSFR